jgi:hypothetical protein
MRAAARRFLATEDDAARHRLSTMPPPARSRATPPMASGVSAPGATPPPVAGAPEGVPVADEEADGDVLADADVLALADSLALAEADAEAEAEAEADADAEDDALFDDDD